MFQIWRSKVRSSRSQSIFERTHTVLARRAVSIDFLVKFGARTEQTDGRARHVMRPMKRPITKTKTRLIFVYIIVSSNLAWLSSLHRNLHQLYLKVMSVFVDHTCLLPMECQSCLWKPCILVIRDVHLTSRDMRQSACSTKNKTRGVQ